MCVCVGMIDDGTETNIKQRVLTLIHLRVLAQVYLCLLSWILMMRNVSYLLCFVCSAFPRTTNVLLYLNGHDDESAYKDMRRRRRKRLVFLLQFLFSYWHSQRDINAIILFFSSTKGKISVSGDIFSLVFD